ncbi:MAG TPA: PilC/PilY family type IV pilus protein [Rhodocyclaceae bacterium]|nr:PilC/PilY family type IV pilus protein [Rhodocyclaceae bacterium]HMW50824.1 PilC/PilY family type IV pilus protein [Rhodocyclaceae bacterium]HNC77936.1 PilC/PilY family type IV pilus protein [Rhodocyclaceae bacterium]HNE14513.1 PilC/PilY family type IV pilus protein [Rhodocyclaceae bacterium]HNF60150.1 PilC/PilY family type IV pilus protein [Rhodocyclaceae bacterium]
MKLSKSLSRFLLIVASASALFSAGLQDGRAASTPLADQPLLTAQVPSNVILALSVEFPTALSVAYNTKFSVDGSAYLGYFDPKKCYKYDSANNYFVPQGPSGTNYTCTSAWSGHFLNWATMQAIDTFRWAMTGGNRVIDLPVNFTDTQPVKTVLQRAYASSDGSECTYFPGRGISASDRANYTDTAGVGYTDKGLWIRNGGQGYQFQVAPQIGGAANCSSWGGGSGSVQSYYAQVEVCKNANGSDGKTLLESNCTMYVDPTGTKTAYRPIGLMQQYKLAMNFGAFGYLYDGSSTRDGGVLRALSRPIDLEISDTGAFYPDPFGLANASRGIIYSGTANYLNKFGSTSLHYKSLDPVSEMYAEVMKYLKGMDVTPSYVSTINNSMRDGFPVFGESGGPTWVDPARDTSDPSYPNSPALWCKKSYIIGIGDTNTWNDQNLSGRTDVSVPSGVDTNLAGGTAKSWTDTVGTTEGYVPSGYASLGVAQPNPGHSNSFLMAGIAYYAHSSDIRTDLKDTQSVDTYWMDVMEGGIYKDKNQFWLAAKYGGYKKPLNTAMGPFNSSTDFWKSQGKVIQTKSDGTVVTTGGAKSYDLPDNYFPANNPANMVSSLQSAFAQISAGTGAAAGVALSNPQVNAASGGSMTFQGTYDASTWSGNVTASNITSFKDDGTPVTTSVWDAAARLNSMVASGGYSSKRKVVTLVPTKVDNATPAVADLVGKPFLYANLSTAQKLNLSKTSLGGDLGDGDKVLNYLRGDRTYETTATTPNLYRLRGSVLGDIIDSKIVYVAAPNAVYSDSYNPGYETFKKNAASRQPVVYVGANDGMLHAFDATSASTGGDELFALVPYALYAGPSNTPDVDGLQAIARTSYSHHYYVDSTPEVRDVDFMRAGGATQSDATKSDWRTLLVAGLGKGGKSFVAMDVTSISSGLTESQVAGKVLWEFFHPDMGFSFGRPLITKTRKWGWVVILSGGYNNIGGDTKAGYKPGQGVVFVVSPKDGSLLQAIYTGAGDAASPAGLAQITGYTQNYQDYTTDYVYGGDLSGNLWRFDFTDSSKSVPSPTKIAQFKDPDGTPQPITVAPKAEYSADDLKRYVFVGTGRLLASSDQKNAQQQTMYALRDGTRTYAFGSNTNQVALPDGVSFPVGRGSMSGVSDLLAGATKSESTPMGWYYDLTGVTSGVTERVVLALQANDGVLSWVGSLPNSDPCSPSGASRLYSVQYGSGQSVFYELVNGLRSPVAYLSIDQGLADITLVRYGSSIRVVGTDTKGGAKVYGNTIAESSDPRVVNWRIIRE